jgi:hypothetical protein
MDLVVTLVGDVCVVVGVKEGWEGETMERASSSFGLNCFSDVITAILNPRTDADVPVAESVAEYL